MCVSVCVLSGLRAFCWWKHFSLKTFLVEYIILSRSSFSLATSFFSLEIFRFKISPIIPKQDIIFGILFCLFCSTGLLCPPPLPFSVRVAPSGHPPPPRTQPILPPRADVSPTTVTPFSYRLNGPWRVFPVEYAVNSPLVFAPYSHQILSIVHGRHLAFSEMIDFSRAVNSLLFIFYY